MRWPLLLGLWCCTLCMHCDATAPQGNGASFAVSALLTQNSCGPQSVPVAQVAQYIAQLSVNDTQATWSVAANGAMATGEYADSVRGFRFEADAYFQVRAANQVTGQAACVMRRYDVIEGSLQGALPPLGDAGVPADASLDAAGGGGVDGGDGADTGPASFQATETILYGPVSGADCSDQVGAGDGQFSQLPCEIIYQMNGSMNGPFMTQQ